MVTNNLKEFFKGASYAKSFVRELNIKCIDGKPCKDYVMYHDSRVWQPCRLLLNSVTRPTGNQYCGYTFILLGTGSTPPTENDYKLESEYSNLRLVSYETTKPKDTINTIRFIATIQNTGNETVTLREVAQFAILLTGYGDQHAMMTRDLLTTPITIKAGQTGVLDLTISATGTPEGVNYSE